MIPELEPAVDAFIAAVPKTDLHLHLIGATPPEGVARLAARNGSTVVPHDPDAVRDYFAFRDFPHFIEVYTAVSNLVRDAGDFQLLVAELGRGLAHQQVRYAEVTVTPMTHVFAGVAEAAIIEGLEAGRLDAERDHGVVIRWCFDIASNDGVEAGLATARFATGYRPDGLVSFGLGGPEVGHERGPFADAFAIARDAGLHSVPHAGETTGPATVWSAIRDLGAERIGHGTSSLGDPDLVAYLRDHQLPLEVCPTSNVCTGAVPSFEDHPLPRMLDAGLLVTLGSDDPPMFGTDLLTEYRKVAATFGLGIAELAQLARNGVEVSFMDDTAKAAMIADIAAAEALPA